ncbi:MAG: exodeoxyribonuclease I [Gammaproteobacteria bacterium]
MQSIFWYDYETSGADPKRDRPFQVGGLRTDLNLNPIEEPVCFYCKPSRDVLPHPQACLITGITPQEALEKGEPEAAFAARLHDELTRPGTCTAGYNSLRFDDELTRFMLYRNFYDAYDWAWRNGNSRWDLIDTVRTTYALRPEGLNWPLREDGAPSFRLEDLTAANGIDHGQAHDALADVYATIAMAKLIKTHQARLFDHLFTLRDKRQVARLLDPVKKTPVVHVTRMYPAEFGCTSMVMPLTSHPENNNSTLVFDLRHDPSPFLKLDEKELARRAFSPNAELGDDEPRLPVKEILANKCPVVLPAKTLDEASAKRIQLDTHAARRHYDALITDTGFIERLRRIYQSDRFATPTDPELMLYSGGFFGDHDRRLMDEVRATPPEGLAALSGGFEDPRLAPMLFRYRARNFPNSLNSDEQMAFEDYRYQRLTEADAGGSLTMDEFHEQLEQLSQSELSERDQAIVDALFEYAESLMA